MLALCVTWAWASNPNYRLCFPHTTWFGAPAPRIDGKPDAPGDPDQGWLGGIRYVVGNGTTLPPDVAVQGVTDGSNLYLSIQGNNLNLFDTHTFVALAYDPGNAADRRRIQIFPVLSGATPNTQVAAQVEYWGTSGTDNSNPPVWQGPVVSGSGLPSWLGPGNFQVGYQQDPVTTKFSWYLEAKLAFATINPITGQPDPATGLLPSATPFFGLYISVMSVKSAGQYHQSSWPPNAPIPGCLSTSNCTANSPTLIPDASTWGTATVDPTQRCNGVSVGTQPNDITVSNANHGTGDTIGFGSSDPNTFHANVSNTTIDPATPPPGFVVAQNVLATWSISSFGMPCPMGLPVCWTKVATTSVPKDIPKATMSGSTVVPGAATLDSTIYAPVTPPADPHQCILVQLDSAPGAGTNTVFVNNAAVQNMQFGTSSVFKRKAVISGKGYPPRAGASDQLFDLVVTTHEGGGSGQVPGAYSSSTNAPPSTAGSRKDKVISQFTWIAEGCRHTGLYLTDKDEKLELCDPVGAFGFTVTHEGQEPVEKWIHKLSGPNLEKISENLYRVHVPQGADVEVTTQIEPQEQRSGQGHVGLFLDAGANIPQGTFGNVFNKGFSLNAGLEYIATSHFSLEGIFGYHHFPSSLLGDLNVYQFSVNGKTYLMSGTIRPFVNGGVGGYKFSPGSTYFGGNFGGGVLFNLTSHFGLQGLYTFHVVNTAGAATKWANAQAGVEVRF
jgi:hypothetical protein